MFISRWSVFRKKTWLCVDSNNTFEHYKYIKSPQTNKNIANTSTAFLAAYFTVQKLSFTVQRLSQILKAQKFPVVYNNKQKRNKNDDKKYIQGVASLKKYLTYHK